MSYFTSTPVFCSSLRYTMFDMIQENKCQERDSVIVEYLRKYVTSGIKAPGNAKHAKTFIRVMP